MRDEGRLDTPARHQRVRAAFDAALLERPSRRERLLDDLLGGDGELRQEVARLLAAHGNAGSFLEHLPQAALADDEFHGTERFTIRRRLGAGGMGIVYEAHDRVRDEVVALKTLRRTGAADLYRLKREFRGLADIAHRNLACLYELFVEEPDSFFTMELVPGVSFVQHVRDAPAERLVPALTQLIEGVAALHRAGKLHRDIKPSNLRVTADGRVVILDFGLLAELAPQPLGGDHEAGGTPAYMAPEEGSGAAPSEASDWYAVGVTLYESLTGRLPFDGSPADVLRRKRESEPARPGAIADGVPPALEAICLALLERDPKRRMSGREALRRLTPAPSVDHDADVETLRTAPFVGRARELAALERAFESVRAGGSLTVQIAGRSGIGKTALLREFLTRVGADAVVFEGRCYEHESVPFKALDGVVDRVSRWLGTLPREAADRVLPREAAVLARLFPVLLQSDAVRDAGQPTAHDLADPARLRRRAVAALRELLSRVAQRQPVILCIDDLHWTDADSIVVLEALGGAAAPARMLTVLCARSEEIAANPMLRTAFAADGDGDGDGVVRVALDPMDDAEASALIAALVPPEAPGTIDAPAITREAAGNPFLLEQFARHVARRASRDRPAAEHTTTFADMFDGQLRTLPAEARAFLETLALCGRPMAPDVVRDASNLQLEIRPLLALLRAAHVIRSSGSSERVEPYHDRIRTALVERMAAEAVRSRHGQLAATLRARNVDDPVALFEHYRGAGDRQEAAAQAGRAAEQAAAALAFDTAASYFHEALGLGAGSPARPAWQAGRAEALANAGRPHEAGDAYLDAARGASRGTSVDLQRRGAEQFLIGGHIDRGLDVLRAVLDDVGMRLPPGPRSALASLLLRRARLRWRGLAFIERPAGEIAPDALRRIDVCWSVITGLAIVDMIRAAAFNALHVRLALDAGEPYRAARALAIEAAFSSLPGGRSRAHTARLFDRAQTLTAEVDHPHTTALCALTRGMAALGIGRFKIAAGLCEEALAILHDRCTGVTWELNGAQNFLLGALLYQGELRDVSARLPALLADARARGNLYVSTELCTRMNLVWLAADQPDEGERLAVESIERWSQTGFHRQHYSAMLARVQTALYRGDAPRAWARLEDSWSALRRSLLPRAQIVRVEASYLRGRCALAMALAGSDSGRLLAVAEGCARRIARERMPWSDPIGWLLEAAVAHQKGRVEESAQRLADAVRGFDEADMQLYAATARHRLSNLLAGEAAAAMRRRSDEWMAGQGVVNPAFMTRMMVAGFH